MANPVFKFEPQSDRYLAIQTRPFSALLGEFTPAKGDLVFTKGGELMGFMVDSKRCYLLQDDTPYAVLPLGKNYDADSSKRVLQLMRNNRK